MPLFFYLNFMTLSDLTLYFSETCSSILRTGTNIHPAMFSYLNYQQLFDDSLADNTLMDRFNIQIVPLIEEFKEECSIVMDDYLTRYFIDTLCIVDCVGYSVSTGRMISTATGFKIPDFIPSVETELVYNHVQTMKSNWDYLLTPWWMRSGHTVYGANETLVMSLPVEVCPVNYINLNRNRFSRSFGESNLKRMERAISIRDRVFDYPIYTPELTTADDRNIKPVTENAVHRHLILKHLVEEVPVGINFHSTVTHEGDVTLTEKK